MNSIKPHLGQTLKSGLVYGLGYVVAIVITGLLFAAVDLTPVRVNMQVEFLFLGLLLAILIVAAGASVGGAIGSLSLPMPADAPKSNWSKAWRGGLSMGPIFGLIMFMFGLILSLFSFYNLTETSSIRFSLLFASAGAAFGGVFGLFLGLLLVKNRGVWQVVLAGLLGFGAGGFALGEGVRRYLLSVQQADLETGNIIWLVMAYLLFGLVGGAALGLAFSYVSQKDATARKIKAWHWAVAGVLVLLLIVWVRPYIKAVAEVLSPRDADLAFVLDSSAIGTHWSESTTVSAVTALSGTPHQPSITANNTEQLAQVWSQVENGQAVIYWLPGQWDANGRMATWHTPIKVSNNQDEAAMLQAVVDGKGVTHIVWEEAANIQYSQCRNEMCSAPVVISETVACAEAVTKQTAPTLAIDDAGTLMAVWQADSGQLLYRTWPAGSQTPAGQVDCVTVKASGMAGQPQLDAGSNGRFGLVYVVGDEAGGDIHSSSYVDARWESPTTAAGNGRWPNIYLDAQDALHLAWCAENGVRYEASTGLQTLSELSCSSRPELIADSSGTLHLLWYGDEVVDVNGQTQPQTVLYESTLDNSEWSEAAIIGRTGTASQPSVTAVADSLLMSWESTLTGELDIATASFMPYSCEDYPLHGISKVAYDLARRPDYRPADDIIPYCQNQYRQLVFMPNPDPAFSEQPAKPNGGFDEFAELAQMAEYEVLFSTMWYEADENNDSPGYVLASSVAQLYEKLKANPQQYPRGLTVRILLGNPPELAIKEFSGQLFNVLADLREAGVEKMVDPEIGWRVEVANFDGALPHSHSKVMIVDGKTILAAGFNMQYEHYAVDHPSGKGKGRQDLGMMVTGPIAQSSHRMFDDLWAGSNQRICTNFYPIHRIWQATCKAGTAVADHVPEVRKYYLPGAASSTFSMYRNKDHDEADRIVENTLSAAQNQVDAMQVMFAMEMECDLNLLYNLCDFGEATEYLNGLMAAAENGATIRLILKPQPTDGIENSIAYDVFIQELENRGLLDQVEIRFFEDPIHYKTTLIDDEFLIVGSQNFHYSAFGQGEGLTEYSLGTDDVQAIEDYKRLFEYQWALAKGRQ
jgi:phosphatidylserine/phosphatidylglycerophosphate/cardiolipin synthase-like enzyme